MSKDQLDLEVIAQELADLHQILDSRYRHVDEQFLEQAIEDAVLYHFRFPEHFDPSRGVPLLCYLAWRARSYLCARLRGRSAIGRTRWRQAFPTKFLKKLCRKRGLSGVFI